MLPADPSYRVPADVGILTVIPPELNAVRDALGALQRVKEDASDTIYWRGTVHSQLRNREYTVVLASIGKAGPPSAAALASQMLERYRPNVVLLVGIAAGMRSKVRIGDVVLSDLIVAYESAALTVSKDGIRVVQPRPEITRAHHGILQDVTNYHFDAARLSYSFDRIRGSIPQVPRGKKKAWREHVASSVTWKAHVAIASGDKLLLDPSKLREIRRDIHGKVEVGEMEAAGVIEACRLRAVPWLVIRGISDFGDELKDDRFHEFASKTAATVMADFLAHGLDLGEEEPKKEQRYRGQNSSGQNAVRAEPLVIASNRAWTSQALEATPPGWLRVDFKSQRDLRAALSGVALGPTDVRTCPEFDEVGLLLRDLEQFHVASLVGESGSGKSITAWHVAYRLHEKGWAVYKLVNPDLGLAHAPSLPHNLLILDNAQSHGHGVVEALAGLASPSRAILFVSTNPIDGQRRTIRMAHERAVRTLAEALLRREKELLPILRELDHSIGEGYLATSVNTKIESAQTGSQIAWQFMFNLGSGERHLSQTLATLRDQDNADLLLAAIAARQLVTKDAGCELAWLPEASRILGHNSEWAKRSLAAIRERGILLDSLGRVSTPHPRVASNILLNVAKHGQSPHYQELLKQLLIDPDLPLGGINWLLRELRGYPNVFWGAKVVDNKVAMIILERCLAVERDEQGTSSFLLAELMHWSRVVPQRLLANQGRIAGWLDALTLGDEYGLSSLLNECANHDREFAAAICRLASPAKLAKRINDCTAADAHALGSLLDRLLYAAPREWLKQVLNELERDRIRQTLINIAPQQLYGVSSLILPLYQLDADFGLSLLEALIPLLSLAFQTDPLEARSNCYKVIWFVLGYAPHFLRRSPPNVRQAGLAADLAFRADPVALARALSRSRPRDWNPWADLMIFFREAAPDFTERVAPHIDLDQLTATSTGWWSKYPDEIKMLCIALALTSTNEPAVSLLRRHANVIDRLDPIVAILAPDVALTALARGVFLDLHIAGGLPQWKVAKTTLAVLAESNRDAAIDVLRRNTAALADGLLLRQANGIDGLAEFLLAAQELDPGALARGIAQINVKEARRTWTQRIAGTDDELAAVMVLLKAALESEGDVRAVAAELTATIPPSEGGH